MLPILAVCSYLESLSLCAILFDILFLYENLLYCILIAKDIKYERTNRWRKHYNKEPALRGRGKYVDVMLRQIKEQVGDKKVLCALSGSVDAVCTALVLKRWGIS